MVIFQRWAPSPVFHLCAWPEATSERVVKLAGAARHEFSVSTVCGLVWSSWGWVLAEGAKPWEASGHFDREFGVRLRRDHAEGFARLCSRCAP